METLATLEAGMASRGASVGDRGFAEVQATCAGCFVEKGGNCGSMSGSRPQISEIWSSFGDAMNCRALHVGRHLSAFAFVAILALTYTAAVVGG